MDLLRILLPMVLLADGIATGVMLSTVIGLAPYQSAVPYPTYVSTIQFLWKRYDPFMPLMNTVALVGDTVLALQLGAGRARPLFALAAALLAAVMIVSVLKNVPINRFVMALDPDREPEDWARLDPRARWRAWNLFRTTLALGALVANLIAVAVLL